MTGSLYLDLLWLALPEVMLALVAFGVLAADLTVLRGMERRLRQRLLALLSVTGTAIACLALFGFSAPGDFMAGMLVADDLSKMVKAAVLLLLAGTCLISADDTSFKDPGEYFALLLFAGIGMMFLVSAEDLLMIFLALEMTSLCLYVLAGFNNTDPRSAEAGLKYFLFGGVAAAFTLFGMSLLYGVTGHTHLPEIAAEICRRTALTGVGTNDPIIVLAMVMTLVGFAFKIAAVPFHLWAPDVYQGAPLPAAAFVASASKVASFFVLGRVLLSGLQGLEGNVTPGLGIPGWLTTLSLLAAGSLIVGNLAALAQTSVRRLLAYSAVAHAGYLLLAFFASGAHALASLLYYAFTYAISTLGAFAVVAMVEKRAGSDSLEAFTGLGRRSPVLASCLLIFLLSLAGIPPLAGFFGKFYVFAAALNASTGRLSTGWLVALAIALSAVSLYYYLRVLKQVYVVSGNREESATDSCGLTRGVAIGCASLTVALGCFPSWLLTPLTRALQQAGF